MFMITHRAQPFVLKNHVLQFINTHSGNEFDPYYLYDSNVIRDNCQTFMAIPWENKSIHFASMANINPEFLKIVREEKVNIFVNSTGHMDIALKAGFRGNEIIFTASALTARTMQKLAEEGIQCNVDSPEQLALWQKLFPGKPIGIRCNIGEKVDPFNSHAGYFLGKESRLGFTFEEADAITNKNMINGLHMYVGTDIFDIDYFLNCYTVLAELCLNFPNLEYLNFGGGFGVSETGTEKFNFETYNMRVGALMEEISRKKGKSIRLVLEPGRIIGGEAGFFVCQVSDVKNRPDRRLVGLNASTVQFSRPLMYPDLANHPVMIIRNGEQVFDDTESVTTIYGCSTYSRDIFTKNKSLPEIKIGDTVVFGIAGSYCASSHSTFLGFAKPEEYFL